MERVALLVIAKEPLPGRVKTRLSPPCSPGEAAALADAALLDTLDAVLGRAADGGYWSIGLRGTPTTVFSGIPMSCATTWKRQHARLRQLGLRVHDQPVLRDVDTIDDARAVARDAPRSRFAATLAAIEA